MEKWLKEPLRELREYQVSHYFWSYFFYIKQTHLLFFRPPQTLKEQIAESMKCIMKLKKRRKNEKLMIILIDLIIHIQVREIYQICIDTLRKDSRSSHLNSRKNSNDYQHWQTKTNKAPQCHFVGSSFGKNSVPAFREMVGNKYTNSNTQSRQTDQEEIKESEEINLKTLSSCEMKSKRTGKDTLW